MSTHTTTNKQTAVLQTKPRVYECKVNSSKQAPRQDYPTPVVPAPDSATGAGTVVEGTGGGGRGEGAVTELRQAP